MALRSPALFSCVSDLCTRPLYNRTSATGVTLFSPDRVSRETPVVGPPIAAVSARPQLLPRSRAS